MILDYLRMNCFSSFLPCMRYFWINGIKWIELHEISVVKAGGLNRVFRADRPAEVCQRVHRRVQ